MRVGDSTMDDNMVAALRLLKDHLRVLIGKDNHRSGRKRASVSTNAPTRRVEA